MIITKNFQTTIDLDNSNDIYNINKDKIILDKLNERYKNICFQSALILEIVKIFRSKVVDIADNSITIEVTGDPGKITTIQKLLRPYQIIEIVRTGKISVERELGINTEYLKNV